MASSGNNSTCLPAPNSPQDADLLDSDVSKLNEVEKASELYLNELTQKIAQLREELFQEDFIAADLQAKISGVKATIESNERREEELGISDLKTMMTQAKEEFEVSKQELEEVLNETLQESSNMAKEAFELTSGVESMRIQFTSKSTLENLLEEGSKVLQAAEDENTAIENRVNHLETELVEMKKDLRSFVGIDVVLNQYQQDASSLDAKNEELSTYIQRLQLNRF